MRALIFLGSQRDSMPPRPARLGKRVAQACNLQLKQMGVDTEVIDPLDFNLAGIFKPHFAYADGRAPDDLQVLAEKISAADCFVMVSPEYNHAMSPALANLLNHFGSSLFSFKPSAIVTYSAGQWGGTRAAVNMRTFLSELGCLPVSAMVHVPHAQDVFDEQSQFAPDVDAERWTGYFGRTFEQLIWWSEAAARQNGVKPVSKPFNKNPSQRDAP